MVGRDRTRGRVGRVQGEVLRHGDGCWCRLGIGIDAADQGCGGDMDGAGAAGAEDVFAGFAAGATVEASRRSGDGAGGAVCEEDGGRGGRFGAPEQAEYVGTFYEAVLAYLAFHAQRAGAAAERLRAVADHATPVGSGTVAQDGADPGFGGEEAAVIASMRHKTTAYDTMVIARVKGKREVRRMLAARSKGLLEGYRAGRVMNGGVVRCSGRVMSDGEMG